MTDRLKEWLDNHLAWNDEDVDVAVAALRAVVELHKSMDVRTSIGGTMQRCHGCCSPTGAPSLWPCPTIRAIEKEITK